ncbi:MAG TPA: hypothetical protein ENI16_00430, partial [Candidatus Portnoybacteria bacterium]|nr:hypothetical protein [Candidatus Portnoybacteria bacterium]
EYIPPIKRPKVETYEDYLFVVLHFPVFIKKTGRTSSGELDILITKDTLITSHRGVFPQLKKFFEDCHLHSQTRKQFMNQTTSHLLYHLLDRMIDSRLPMLDQIAEKIDQIEDQVFKGEEREMVSEISMIKRDILHFRKAIKPQRAVLENLSRGFLEVFPHFKEFRNLKFLVIEVIGSEIEVWNVLENHKETIEAIEKTNDALLSYKISDIVKILTVISFITFPLGVIAGIFGMNVFRNVEFVNSPYAFWIIIGAMLLAAVIMFIFFKKKKWL